MAPTDYDHWQSRYARPDYLFGTAPNEFLRQHAHLLKPGQTALAIADGEGRNGVFMAEKGLNVVSVDFSPLALEKARKLAAARKVTMRIEQADIINREWPPETYDVVAAIFFQFATPPQRDAIFAGIGKTLKPGGLLLLEGYRPKQLEYKTGGPPQVENLYTRETLEAGFAGFASIDIREHDSEIAEGAQHVGMSALIDLVGRK